MDFDTLHARLMAFPGAEAGHPFGPGVLVYKVAGKMFALVNPADAPLRVNLKCQPEWAIALRETYPAVLPGYHMNKRHWNTVVLDGSVPAPELARMIDVSYELVVRSLKKAERLALGAPAR